ncbi:MAG: hypothetical protein GF399_09275 [Candidatus Coatesbacteria bacterium]|nr:hypothetical protein [Candidatus Coatesbacteria bacterium]
MNRSTDFLPQGLESGVENNDRIITEDEHQLLQLGTYICVNEFIIPPPKGGAMWRGRAGRGSGTSNVPKGNYRCADGRRAHKKLSPSGFHHRRIDHDRTLVDVKGHINGLEASGATPNAAAKPITLASNATSGSLSVKGRSASTIETPKTCSTTSGADFALVHYSVIIPKRMLI